MLSTLNLDLSDVYDLSDTSIPATLKPYIAVFRSNYLTYLTYLTHVYSTR